MFDPIHIDKRRIADAIQQHGTDSREFASACFELAQSARMMFCLNPGIEGHRQTSRRYFKMVVLMRMHPWSKNAAIFMSDLDEL